MPHTSIAIIGSGFAGLGAAIRLQQEGFGDHLVFERGDEVGGVWRDNSYPGCACDVESHLYSFSFAPNPAWSRVYAPQAEILAYLENEARRVRALPDALERLEYLSQEAWHVADRLEGEAKVDALTVALRVDLIASSARRDRSEHVGR